MNFVSYLLAFFLIHGLLLQSHARFAGEVSAWEAPSYAFSSHKLNVVTRKVNGRSPPPAPRLNPPFMFKSPPPRPPPPPSPVAYSPPPPPPCCIVINGRPLNGLKLKKPPRIPPSPPPSPI
uniref:Extensin domain-containing protein n=1 Tax=Manihot esculenta TaxID=3983 RepID=A0A2C9VI36_MANES